MEQLPLNFPWKSVPLHQQEEFLVIIIIDYLFKSCIWARHLLIVDTNMMQKPANSGIWYPILENKMNINISWDCVTDILS